MSLLVDHQLPPRLAEYFREKGVEARHVSELGFEVQSDRFIWQHAAAERLDIVSKDEDFFYLAKLDETGPRLMWVRVGNCSSGELLQVFNKLWPQLEYWMRSRERVIEIR